ncbi:MAG: APC family permease [Gemmatimonadota bacterium]|nr:APC family permease [Gemmatimonadota bacterium]MDE3005485.1 APC family permease [Gemmatimonadota bacterium]MDE3013384.1 APC family permease [Gemmatimonadota bacterium]
MAQESSTGLERRLGLLGLAATGICSMLGAAINIIPFMLQRSVPGIGPYVLPAYLFAAVPAILAALAYATLSSAMPRAGGSYVFASRGLSPYLGFVASFSQWFGLSVAIGVVSYVMIPFIRDAVGAFGMDGLAMILDQGPVRVGLALAFLWTSVFINMRGVGNVERVLVPLMFVMFVLGGVVIVAGFLFDQQDFAAGLMAREGATVQDVTAEFSWSRLLAASAILFSSFIGFDSIAQAGGEAKNPERALPMAIGIAIGTVGLFYFMFTAAVYNTVPWQFVAERAQAQDLTAPGLLGYVLEPQWTALIVAGAAIALINDLPAMLLAVSRLMFAWAEDGVFPRGVAKVHPSWHTPHVALVLSGLMATASILGSHFAGDFFLGVDILVTSMLVNFGVMCLTVLSLPSRNPEIASRMTVIRNRSIQAPLALLGALLLALFLGVHLWKDITADLSAWYFHSTPLWIAVMAGASVVYFREVAKLKADGVDVDAIFAELPPE